MIAENKNLIKDYILQNSQNNVNSNKGMNNNEAFSNIKEMINENNSHNIDNYYKALHETTPFFLFEFFVFEMILPKDVFITLKKPILLFRLFDYPSQTIIGEKLEESKTKINFNSGKTCFFEMEIEVYKRILYEEPLYIMLVDDNFGQMKILATSRVNISVFAFDQFCQYSGTPPDPRRNILKLFDGKGNTVCEFELSLLIRREYFKYNSEKIIDEIAYNNNSKYQNVEQNESIMNEYENEDKNENFTSVKMKKNLSNNKFKNEKENSAEYINNNIKGNNTVTKNDGFENKLLSNGKLNLNKNSIPTSFKQSNDPMTNSKSTKKVLNISNSNLKAIKNLNMNQSQSDDIINFEDNIQKSENANRNVGLNQTHLNDKMQKYSNNKVVLTLDPTKKEYQTELKILLGSSNPPPLYFHNKCNNNSNEIVTSSNHYERINKLILDEEKMKNSNNKNIPKIQTDNKNHKTQSFVKEKEFEEKMKKSYLKNDLKDKIVNSEEEIQKLKELKYKELHYYLNNEKYKDPNDDYDYLKVLSFYEIENLYKSKVIENLKELAIKNSIKTNVDDFAIKTNSIGINKNVENYKSIQAVNDIFIPNSKPHLYYSNKDVDKYDNIKNDQINHLISSSDIDDVEALLKTPFIFKSETNQIKISRDNIFDNNSSLKNKKSTNKIEFDNDKDSKVIIEESKNAYSKKSDIISKNSKNTNEYKKSSSKNNVKTKSEYEEDHYGNSYGFDTYSIKTEKDDKTKKNSIKTIDIDIQTKNDNIKNNKQSKSDSYQFDSIPSEYAKFDDKSLNKRGLKSKINNNNSKEVDDNENTIEEEIKNDYNVDNLNKENKFIDENENGKFTKINNKNKTDILDSIMTEKEKSNSISIETNYNFDNSSIKTDKKPTMNKKQNVNKEKKEIGENSIEDNIPFNNKSLHNHTLSDNNGVFDEYSIKSEVNKYNRSSINNNDSNNTSKGKYEIKDNSYGFDNRNNDSINDKDKNSNYNFDSNNNNSKSKGSNMKILNKQESDSVNISDLLD